MAYNPPLEELISQGAEFLSSGQYYEAIETLEKALLIQDTVLVRNQLALAYFYDARPLKAMEILRSTLAVNDSQPFHHPFSFSLAAIILASLGRGNEAERFLDLAIEGYREGSRLLEEAGLPFDTVGAYLAMMMKAAGELGQHRRLLELFQSWKKEYLSWECVYYAAAAAFNLCAYRLAADYWAATSRSVPLCLQMQKLALMVEDELVPPFTLEYRVMSSQELQEQIETAFADPSYQEEFISRGYARMLLLGHLFGPESVSEETARTILHALVGWGGEWGLELGRRLAAGSAVPAAIQQAARQCLAEAGDLNPGDITWPEDEVASGRDGEDESASSLNGLEVIQVDYSPDMEAIFAEACHLISQGRNDDALTLWEEVLYEKRRLYPPAMFNMVDLYTEMQRYEDAASILDLLEQVSQAEQGVFNQEIFFKRALLAYYEGNPETAWRHLDRIDIGSLTETEHASLLDFRQLLRDTGLEGQEGVSRLDGPSGDAVSYREVKRRQVEDKKLPLQPTMLRGLKNMPAAWIDAVCLNLGIITGGQRRARQQQIVDWLIDPRLLGKLVRTLDEEQRTLLRYILGQNGWTAIADISPRFGALEGESYDWLNEGTSTLLGTLWSLGLIMIGRAGIDGRNIKIAAIPAELRELLPTIL